MSTNSGPQTLRFQRAEPKPDASVLPPRHKGILQDQLRRAAKRPWAPSFSLAFRILLLIRVTGAMYTNIQDCDEVFNFWEPLHFLDKGRGFQTWEVSPEFAIRSWNYIMLHMMPARLASAMFGADNKRPAFFAVRITLGLLSTLSEAKFYRIVYEKINERVGRYLFFMLLFSAGMWNASTAFLPSSFSMYATMMAFSYAIAPSNINNSNRTLLATVFFAAGGIVGWPFALALAVPFVFEELFILSGDRIAPEVQGQWRLKRWRRLITAGVTASLLMVPVVCIDTLAYGRLVVVPWNIIRYNIFGGSERGPELYGIEPPTFYIRNLVLNFNILVPFALISLPALVVTHTIDRRRLGFGKTGPDQSSPLTVLGLRLAPFYVWLGILSSQAHKEERFMFPAYPLLCFNAAVAIYLIRGWMEVAFVGITKSPYRASQSKIFRNFTFTVVVASSILSLGRILALWEYYHAPMTVAYALETYELPRLLNDTGLLPPAPPGVSPDDLPRIDLAPIREFNLTLCVGKEWYRFPGHYLIPDGIRVGFVKSEFNGLLPGQFGEGGDMRTVQGPGSAWWTREETRAVPGGLNDLNREEPSHYVRFHILLKIPCSFNIGSD
jgi:alpha-1,2-mannosyltransferase